MTDDLLFGLLQFSHSDCVVYQEGVHPLFNNITPILDGRSHVQDLGGRRPNVNRRGSDLSNRAVPKRQKVLIFMNIGDMFLYIYIVPGNGDETATYHIFKSINDLLTSDVISGKQNEMNLITHNFAAFPLVSSHYIQNNHVINQIRHAIPASPARYNATKWTDLFESSTFSNHSLYHPRFNDGSIYERLRDFLSTDDWKITERRTYILNALKMIEALDATVSDRWKLLIKNLTNAFHLSRMCGVYPIDYNAIHDPQSVVSASSVLYRSFSCFECERLQLQSCIF